jgi:hypothetical protein
MQEQKEREKGKQYLKVMKSYGEFDVGFNFENAI